VQDKKEKDGKDEKEPAKDGAPQSKEAQQRSLQEFDMRKMFKEGQRFITPPLADSTRAFYESLFKENADSKIAIKYCIENGILPNDEHNKLLKKFNKMKEKGMYSNSVAFAKSMEKKEKKEGKEGKEPKEKKEKKDKKEKTA